MVDTMQPRVSFAPQVFIRKFHCSEDEESTRKKLFYTKKDFRRIERENQVTVDLIEADLFVETCARSSRGLEGHTIEGEVKREVRRRRIVSAVLSEQTHQRKCRRHNPDRIASVARQKSFESVADAFILGMSDVDALRRNPEIDDKILSNKAETVTRPENAMFLILLEERMGGAKNQPVTIHSLTA